MGYNALTYQKEFDSVQYPILNSIYKFLVKVSDFFIRDYLKNAWDECKFEGELHIPSYLAKLHLISRKIGFHEIPENYSPYFLLDEKNNRYYPLGAKFWTEIIEKYEENIATLEHCTDKELYIMQRLAHNLFFNYFTYIEENYQNKKLSESEFFDILLRFIHFYNSHIHYRIDENERDLEKLLDLIPNLFFFKKDLPEEFLELICIENSHKKLRNIIDFFQVQKDGASKDDCVRFFNNFAYILAHIHMNYNDPLKYTILDAIPIDAFLIYQDSSIIWYLIFNEKYSNVSKFLMHLFDPTPLIDIRNHLEEISDFLVLYEDSHLIPSSEDFNINHLGKLYRYFSDGDWLFPAYLQNCTEFLDILLQYIPNQLLFQHIPFGDFAELTGNFEFIPLVLDKYIKIAKKPEFDLFESTEILHFLGEALNTVIIFSSEAKIHEISRQLREYCYYYLPNQIYYSGEGVYISTNIEKILPLVSKFDLPIDLRNRVKFLKTQYLVGDWEDNCK